MEEKKNKLTGAEERKSNLTGEQIGIRMRRARNLRGLSQAELGERIGLSTDRGQGYENGKRRPKWELIKSIAKALDISEEIFDSSDMRTPVGVILALFEIEERYGISFRREDKLYLEIAPGNEDIRGYIEEWANAKRLYEEETAAASTDEEKKKLYDEYTIWRMEFPQNARNHAEGNMKAKQEAFLRNKIAELTEELNKLTGDTGK